MSGSNDFGELKVPVDLFMKMKHDLQRMEAAEFDQYAAFDFFVTADGLVDWVHPEVIGDKTTTNAAKLLQSDLRKNHDLPRIASHIANGAKHFVVSPKRHKSITGIEKSRYVEPGNVEEGYFEDPLLVHLAPDEATRLRVSSPIRAIELARLVLRFWAQHLGVA